MNRVMVFGSKWFNNPLFICLGLIVACCVVSRAATAQDTPGQEKKAAKNGDVAKPPYFGWPLVLEENFSTGNSRWQPTDPTGWKLFDLEAGKAFGLSTKTSKYKPKVRSPWNIAMLKDVVVSDCVMEVKVQSTVKEYPHRDAVLVFGYQSPQRFYYTHFASRADDAANQIFIVNDAARTKISEKSSEGVKWTDDWHHLKIVRKVEDGLIEAYFDDMETPIMTAHDKTFSWGQIGIGSFDDTARYSEVKLWGNVAKPAEP
jgi:hypothetical protein